MILLLRGRDRTKKNHSRVQLSQVKGPVYNSTVTIVVRWPWSNYQLPESSFAEGTLTIPPAPLTITANDQSVTFGGVLPTSTAPLRGLVNADTS